MIKSTGRTISASIAIIITCLKLTRALELAVPKPDTVFVPVPYDLLENVQWMMGDPGKMHSTCGTFDTYKEHTSKLEQIVGRWYTMYMSNIPIETDYCSQFSNVQLPCGCLGIDFTTALGEGLVSFVMFSSNTAEMAVTYEIIAASVIGKNQLNFNQLVMRTIVVHPNATILGKGAYLIPSGAIVDTDHFQSYIILLLCKEGGLQPIVMVLVNALPMADDITEKVFQYLKDNRLDTKLLKVYDQDCRYARNIVGLYN
ncbi:Calycin [Cinara cedri]|uniref:Calycin n=1 Tax=Cinara cedri TaxID=506608 RepID=A0A5E4LZH9_9HEMI|nr:Calycin [Cinara cedri]